MKNKEILEELAEKESEVQGWGKYDGSSEQYAIKESFINGYKLAKERSYSEEDLKSAYNASDEGWVGFDFWFEQFKKETWYNEEQTNKRMNVIGQNGNDGTHYENK